MNGRGIYDCNLTRSYWPGLRVESKRERERGSFSIAGKEMPNHWIPTNRTILPVGQKQLPSTPRRNKQLDTRSSLDRVNADLFNLSSIVVLLVERFASEKPPGRISRPLSCASSFPRFSFHLDASGSRGSHRDRTRFSPIEARPPLWNSLSFQRGLIYLPAGFRLLYVSRLNSNVTYQLMEIPAYVIRTSRAALLIQIGSQYTSVPCFTVRFRCESRFEGKDN